MPISTISRRKLLLRLFTIAVIVAGTVEGQTLTGTVDVLETR